MNSTKGTLIVTDSGCDLPDEWLKAHSVVFVPLAVIFGMESFTDRKDIDNQKFFEKLATADKPPTTSQPPPGAFVEVFDRALAEGKDVLCLTMSARMSGTHSSAMTAAEQSSADVKVQDSEAMSGLLADQVIRAAEVVAAGGSRDDAAAEADRVRTHQELLFTVPNLDALKAGGRIGPAAAMLGGFLQIRPILTMQAGEVHVQSRVRTNTKAREAIINRLREKTEAAGKKARVFVATASNQQVQDELYDQVQPYADGEVTRLEIGPVIAAHTGAGTGGIVYRID
ncbi:MAG: DegV family protein [Candidatus Dormibacteraeota bacterium]|nr:DegV family protein [Candidatus Dormibacteraeota bacterium]